MPKILVSLPNAGPVDLDIPGWGLFRNGETYPLDEEKFSQWLEENTTQVGEGEYEVADLPYGMSIVDDEEGV